MFPQRFRAASTRLLIAAICGTIPATSGCAVLDRLDLLNCQASQLVYNTNKLEETNQRLKETNDRLAELGEKADAMDKKLATLEKAARRLSPGVSESIGPNEPSLSSRPPAGYDVGTSAIVISSP